MWDWLASNVFNNMNLATVRHADCVRHRNIKSHYQYNMKRELQIPNKGGSQFTFASVWESRNIKTSPAAALAPISLARMSPSLLFALITLTFGKCFLMYFSKSSLSSSIK